VWREQVRPERKSDREQVKQIASELLANEGIASELLANEGTGSEVDSK